ncbi:hypothetical protein HOLleu_36940 [Holothuria leucospilota]|uniref:Uncharacterized protein n=1 Tax=Holothuria leucospilota TaxID=206669 RepID=A0A9Q1BGY7_HOLLE|nr:hypothetical protein HOLleu_36940 [Holothuria leucospilota]
MMKRYYEREDCDISKDESVHDVNSNTNDTGDQVCIINADHELSNDEIKANNVPDMCIKLQNSDVLKNLDQKLHHLDHKEKSEMKSLINEYACLFSDDPTRTNLIEHDVDVGDATPIKQHPYRVNPRKRQHLRDEVRITGPLFKKLGGILLASWWTRCVNPGKQSLVPGFLNGSHGGNPVWPAEKWRSKTNIERT